MTEVTKRPTAPVDWSEDQVDLIKNTIAREQNLSDDELKLFLYTAGRLGLDPLAKQIYAIRRGGRITFQSGIDGYRLCAARTGEYAGSTDPEFSYGELGDLDTPVKATVTVKRIVQGQVCEFTASARWDEYNAGNAMWKKMAHTMLGKCAESLALRKAFPAELSGVYTDAEMDQAGRPDGQGAPTTTPAPKALTGDPDAIPVGQNAGKHIGELSEKYLRWLADVEDLNWPDAERWQEAAFQELKRRGPPREPGEEPYDIEAEGPHGDIE